ncbi:glycoside hydrolase superfamily [Apiospora marii]|uniref:glycoside hydrolase superfamily n=1 Tax=Apiospora marii TaxID=335849 RepID=UPI0031316D40
MPRESSWAPSARITSVLVAVVALLIFVSEWHNSPGFTATVIKARRNREFSLEFDHVLESNTSLNRRDNYSCSSTAPCSNGACCGASGFCGYGPKYCGHGCVSQCDATAECGEYASNPGKKCPLNVCCSQYGMYLGGKPHTTSVRATATDIRYLGFCGTTQDFCDDKCQSNCVQHPSPPGGGKGHVFDKVIGYYESWSNGKSCHDIGPTDLPLDALTHVNYAFAYIDPGSYQIVTMDSATPGSLFDDLTTLKTIKPDLEVWVSIGGWTFSDNNTATQPVFGDIAADAGKRQKFANNLVHFMQQHGFNGVDLDWEYPGAPDRGGKKEDTANYVQLLKTLRSTFDGSGVRHYIHRTKFILVLALYSDWINFMTYDLHGVWDADNPIGSIVQGHTNLTEIKLATELLWRVGVPPNKVVLGFGFYGRSFTLADASCSKPGCSFSGASKPGPCTSTGGYLGHYEIQQVLKSGAKPVHDSEAAVNYLVFDDTQWISYDDSVTFKQKADWANKVGLGGSMIWASDLDDDSYSAHSALLGRKINPTNALQHFDDLLQKVHQLSLATSIKGQTGEGCKKYEGDCQDLNDHNALAHACGTGYTVVGWDDAGCGKKNHHYGLPICCPLLSVPTSCSWRGDNTGGVSGDCSSECQEGEVNVGGIYSHWGGGFTNDGNTNRCRRGEKAFCCVAPDYAAIRKKCSLTSCSGSCPPGSTPMFKYYDDCWLGRYKTYCCPDPAPVSDCHWVGDGGDCKNVHRSEDEIEFARDAYGDPDEGSWACSWGRKKAACCKIGQVESQPATCSSDPCESIPGYCPPINYDSGGDDEGARVLFRRDSVESDYEIQFKRGITREYKPPPHGPVVTAIPMAYRMLMRYCIGPALEAVKINLPARDDIIRGDLDVEHPVDKHVIAGSFVVSMFTGVLPTGKRARLQKISQSFFDKWNTPNKVLGAFPGIGSRTGPQPNTINGRVMTALGANGWREPFVLLQKSVNIAKGHVFKEESAVAHDKIEMFARRAMKLDTEKAADELLSLFRTAFAVFEYLSKPHVKGAWVAVNSQMRLQLGYVERVTGINILVNWWDVWFVDFSEHIGRKGQDWAEKAIGNVMRIMYESNKAATDAGRPEADITNMLREQLGSFADRIKDMRLPSLPQIPLLPPPDGGVKRDIWDGKSWVVDSEDPDKLELDEGLWESASGGTEVY